VVFGWIVYRSRPIETPWPDVIPDIIRSSEHWNAADGITGMLLYSKDTYLQYIEGEAEPLSELWRDLELDKRHRIIWSRQGEREDRQFGKLAMGYFDGNRETSAVQDWQIWRRRYEWPETDADELMRLLLTVAQEKYPQAAITP